MQSQTRRLTTHVLVLILLQEFNPWVFRQSNIDFSTLTTNFQIPQRAIVTSLILIQITKVIATVSSFPVDLSRQLVLVPSAAQGPIHLVFLLRLFLRLLLTLEPLLPQTFPRLVQVQSPAVACKHTSRPSLKMRQARTMSRPFPLNSKNFNRAFLLPPPWTVTSAAVAAPAMSPSAAFHINLQGVAERIYGGLLSDKVSVLHGLVFRFWIITHFSLVGYLTTRL
jgi:hypothetical protein